MSSSDHPGASSAAALLPQPPQPGTQGALPLRRGPRSWLYLHGALVLCIAVYGTGSLFSSVVFYKELYVFGEFPYFINTINTVTSFLFCGALGFALLLCVARAPELRAAQSPRFFHDYVAVPNAPAPHSSSARPARPARPAGDVDITLALVLRGSVLGSTFLLTVLGLCNALQNTLQIAAIDALGPSRSTLTTLLAQSVIPFTVIFTCVLVGKGRLLATHNWPQLAGSALVVAGVAVVLWPELVPGAGGGGGGGGGGGNASTGNTSPGNNRSADNNRSTGGGGAASGDDAAVAVWVSIYVISCLPQALLNVLVESAFAKEGRAEAAEPSGRLAALRRRPDTVVARALLLVAAMNVVAAPFNVLIEMVIAQARVGSLNPVHRDFAQGWGLLVGTQQYSSSLLPGAASHDGAASFSNGIVAGSASNASNGTLPIGGAGDGQWAIVLGFMPLGCLFIVGAVLVVHMGSATAMFLVTAACLPLQDCLLSLRSIMGSNAGSVSSFTFAGLAVIVGGLVLYGWGASKHAPATATAAAAATATIAEWRGGEGGKGRREEAGAATGMSRKLDMM